MSKKFSGFLLILSLAGLLAACGEETQITPGPITPIVDARALQTAGLAPNPTRTVSNIPTLPPGIPTPTPTLRSLSPEAFLVLTSAAQSRITPSLPTPTPTVPNTAAAQATSTAVVATRAARKIEQPKVLRTEKDNFRQRIEFTELPPLNDGAPTLLWIDTPYCQPCSQMQPVIDGFKQKFSTQIKFAAMDFYDNATVAINSQFSITRSPAFILYDGRGAVLSFWRGVVEASEIERALVMAVGRA
jgi:thiol-disulfide isomerase/thioredoxin